jgi:hypothetical protein
MVDDQVDDAVHDKHVNKVMVFADWVRSKNQEDWLTEHGKIKCCNEPDVENRGKC